jgi:glutaredoxin|tara:strand:- start:203 stop:466 length:264 start_codon:yes stop_codon:yes gene_type:complete
MSKVRVYGFEDCPYCVELLELYDENNINYEYVDIYVEKFKEEVKIVMEKAETDKVPIILVNQRILAPDNSFKTIREAYLLTNKFLSE